MKNHIQEIKAVLSGMGKRLTWWNMEVEKREMYETLQRMSKKHNPIELWDLINRVRIDNQKNISIRRIKKAVYLLIDDEKIRMDEYGNISVV